ncbi:MAG TPA: DUF3667 domain-containing protein [Azospirillaceae bacterium]|nr:DUF3667 domain-containing protein [Azospirillaceae bacterium]
MSSEIEAAGGLATAGLTAIAIEGEAGGRAGHVSARCANCATVLQGPYCHGCGQTGHVHRSVLHLVEEFIHGILHFDGKALRTLPLLAFRPGTLTRRYIHGRRAAYVSPLALFLFSVFLMFFVFSSLTGPLQTDGFKSSMSAEVRARLIQDLVESRTELSRAEATLRQAEASGAGVAAAQAALDALTAQVAEMEKVLTSVYGGAAEAGGAAGGAAADGSPRAIVDGQVAKTLLKEMKIDTGNAALDAQLRKAADNPDLVLYKMKSAAYKFAFLLIPLSLPFVWLMFAWRRDVALYDHVIFSLYSLSFMSLLVIIVAALARMGDGVNGLVGALLVLTPPVHLYAQLKGTYALGIGGALWRTAAMLIVAVFALLSFALFILMLGVAD